MINWISPYKRLKTRILSLVVKHYDRKESRGFWQQESPDGNNPYDYLSTLKRSQFLYQFMPKLPKNAKILEIGCNVGRNLNYLYNKGFKNLYGIEINPYALKIGRVHYPQLYNNCKLKQGEAQNLIKQFKDGELDLIYSMAVLQHIPDSNHFFKNIAHKTKRYLLTIEDETHITNRHFPRNYKNLFEKLNLKQYKKTTNIPNNIGEFEGFVARLFIKN
jgi:SAM-dependent methyltransferase